MEIEKLKPKKISIDIIDTIYDELLLEDNKLEEPCTVNEFSTRNRKDKAIYAKNYYIPYYAVKITGTEEYSHKVGIACEFNYDTSNSGARFILGIHREQEVLKKNKNTTTQKFEYYKKYNEDVKQLKTIFKNETESLQKFNVSGKLNDYIWDEDSRLIFDFNIKNNSFIDKNLTLELIIKALRKMMQELKEKQILVAKKTKK